jgi:2,3-bisphosphoglycerate-independent phosphoglycerate mutase
VKYIILIADGMADLPLDELGGKTPLEVARTPQMDQACCLGKVAMVQNTPQGLKAGSDVGNLSVMGYDPAQVFTGRGPLEAAHLGISLKANELIFRCNLVTISEGEMVDYSAGQITTSEARVLMAYLEERLDEERIHLHAGVGYRHLMTIRLDLPKSMLKTVCVPPHEIVGEQIDGYYPHGPESLCLRDAIRKSQEILSTHEINQIRIDLGENPATAIWPWSGGKMPRLETFQERFGISGSVITAVGIVRGIGALAGLKSIHVPGATGYHDTDYAGKTRAALESLKEQDFVYMHVEAADDASHNGNLRQKITVIENFDRFCVGPALRYLKEHRNTRIMIGSDHMTCIRTRAHRADPVPFIFCGSGISPGWTQAFGEGDAQASPMRFMKGHELMPFFLKESQF